jgi:hypothetical protein
VPPTEDDSSPCSQPTLIGLIAPCYFSYKIHTINGNHSFPPLSKTMVTSKIGLLSKYVPFNHTFLLTFLPTTTPLSPTKSRNYRSSQPFRNTPKLYAALSNRTIFLHTSTPQIFEAICTSNQSFLQERQEPLYYFGFQYTLIPSSQPQRSSPTTLFPQ